MKKIVIDFATKTPLEGQPSQDLVYASTLDCYRGFRGKQGEGVPARRDEEGIWRVSRDPTHRVFTMFRDDFIAVFPEQAAKRIAPAPIVGRPK